MAVCQGMDGVLVEWDRRRGVRWMGQAVTVDGAFFIQKVSIVQHGQGVAFLKKLGASHNSQSLQWDLTHSIVSDEHIALHLLDFLGRDRGGEG